MSLRGQPKPLTSPATRNPVPQHLGTPNVLFLFCHADDLEIACGGTAASLARTKCQLALVLATDESDESVAALRRQEARRAADTLGIDRERVCFSDCRIGTSGAIAIRWTPPGAASAARLLTGDRLHPCRTRSPQRHRALAEIAHTALRNTCICGVYVVNSLDHTRCRPKRFVEVSEVRDVKRRALLCHESQDALGRIRLKDVENLERAFARGRALEFVEAFEVRDHAGTPEVQTFLSGLNGCRFSRFWNESLSDGALCIVSEHSAGAMTPDYQPSASTRAAIDQLRRRLERGLYGHLDMTERCADDHSVLEHCRSGHIVLVGGTNPLTARRFNRYRSLRYVVDYERTLPGRRTCSIA